VPIRRVISTFSCFLCHFLAALNSGANEEARRKRRSWCPPGFVPPDQGSGGSGPVATPEERRSLWSLTIRFSFGAKRYCFLKAVQKNCG
jgi:hypothetical protein